MSTSAAFDPVDFLERAVHIPSHEDVGEMRDLLVDALDSHGAAVEVDPAGNTLATRGEGAPHLVLNTHVDTVSPHVPFERDGEVIRGRGSCDAKGPLAALLSAFLGADPAGRLTLAVTPDEETLSTGAAALSLDADAYVVGEPTGLDVCNAARGRFQGTISVGGANAHAASPAEGVNAISAAAPVISALEDFDDARGPGVHDTLGAPTLVPTVIQGGDASNQIPDRVEITFDRRTVPPESAEEFRSGLEAHLRDAVPATATVSVSLAERDTPFLEAFATPADEEIVRVLSDASGGAVRPFGAATGASYFAASAPTVVFGPGDLADEEGAVAHANREYVRVPEVLAAAEAVETAVDRFGRAG